MESIAQNRTRQPQKVPIMWVSGGRAGSEEPIGLQADVSAPVGFADGPLGPLSADAPGTHMFRAVATR